MKPQQSIGMSKRKACKGFESVVLGISFCFIFCISMLGPRHFKGHSPVPQCFDLPERACDGLVDQWAPRRWCRRHGEKDAKRLMGLMAACHDGH